MVVVIMHSSGGQIIIIIIILFSFVDKQGTGSSPVCYSSVPSRFNMDECHLETKQSKGQKISHGILFPSLHLFSLFISLFQMDQTWASKYQRHQNKRTKDVSVVLGILSVSARVVRLGSSQ